MRYNKKPKEPLSYEEIQALPPGRHYRGQGLVILVTPKGRRFFRFRYTSPSTGRVTEVSIGEFPYDSYWDALQQTYQMMVLVAKGEDPVLLNRLKRGAGKAFAEVHEAWLNHHRPKWHSTHHIETMAKYTRSFAQMPVRIITTSVIVNALSPKWGHYPEQARRVLSMTARVFDYAKAMGWRTGDNPAAWRGCMEHIFPNRPKNRNQHFKSMPFQEVPELVRRLKLRLVKGQSASALLFLIYTAARTSEVRNMKWLDVDWDNCIWKELPKLTAKHRYRTPLSPQCMEILALQREYRVSDYVFPGRNGGPLGARALFILLRDMGIFLTVHGFRASFKTWATTETDHPWEVIELCLGHEIGTKVAQAYLRGDAIEKRRVVMQEWSKYCG